MKIAEIYGSIQGEGLLTGTPSVFVRASGCNLRCWFCDTPYASWQPEGDDLGVEEVFEQVSLLATDHVVLTGGEPMLFAELIPLAAALREAGKHITIETAGTLHLPVACDLMSISPKLANSTPSLATAGRWRRRHNRARFVPDVMRRLLAEFDYQLKFVIDTPADCEEVQAWLDDFAEVDRSRVLLMPQGRRREELAEREPWLEPYCLEQGFGYCHRRQIEWFGLVRGT
jgi:7-carboxy-7-deazaguanine synthase